MSYPVDKFTELMTTLASDLSGLKMTELAEMELLVSAILDQAVKKAITNKLHTYHLMTHRLQQLDMHTGYFLLKSAFSLPRLLFILRFISSMNQLLLALFTLMALSTEHLVAKNIGGEWKRHLFKISTPYIRMNCPS